MRPILAVLFIALFFSAPAFAQGYEGLIAPAEETPAAPKAQEPQEYKGVLPGAAPKRDTRKFPDPKKVMQGKVKPKATKLNPPGPPKKSVNTNMSRNPAVTGEKKKVETSDQLKNVAHLQRYLNENPPQKVSGVNPKYANLRVPKIDGLSVQEYSLKSMIDDYMETLNDPKLSKDVKQKEARYAYESLKLIADGIRVKKMIPDSAYLDMGMPPEFVKEERESNDNSMRRLEEAFNRLRPLQ